MADRNGSGGVNFTGEKLRIGDTAPTVEGMLIDTSDGNTVAMGATDSGNGGGSQVLQVVDRGETQHASVPVYSASASDPVGDSPVVESSVAVFGVATRVASGLMGRGSGGSGQGPSNGGGSI